MTAYNIEELYPEGAENEKVETANTFLGWLKHSKTGNFGRQRVIRQQQSLIENFIKTDPKIQPVKGVLQDIPSEQEDKDSAEPKIKHIVSETLAKVYYKQKKYQLAIETYEKLGLVYPEKSSYFARLIDTIEKETENK